MQNFEKIWSDENLIKVLQKGGVVVMPTDTIYGICGRAEDKNTVERIYKIRKRNPEKPCIILIGDISELRKFSINITDEQRKILESLWNIKRATSIVLDCLDKKLKYLHRGTNSLAFRIPTSKILQNLLLKTGPLIAPSANTEGNPPSKNILGAKNYFGNEVDLYIDGGDIFGQASKIIRLHSNGTFSIIRE